MRLSENQIHQIVRASADGKSPITIANTFKVDVSTVKLHVESFENRYGDISYVYSLLKPVPRRKCEHPSFKCLLCGMAQDGVRSKERETIQQLQRRLDEANSLLDHAGYKRV